MIKRFMGFFCSRSSSTPVRTEIDTVTNPLSENFLIGLSTYAPSQESRSQLEKNNTWEDMSDMSDDPVVVEINLEKDSTRAEPMILAEQVNILKRSDSRLLMTPNTRLVLNKSGVFSTSPDDVEDLEAQLSEHVDEQQDEYSAYSSLSPIILHMISS